MDANKTLTTYLRKGTIAPQTLPALEAVNRRVLAALRTSMTSRWFPVRNAASCASTSISCQRLSPR